MLASSPPDLVLHVLQPSTRVNSTNTTNNKNEQKAITLHRGFVLTGSTGVTLQHAWTSDKLTSRKFLKRVLLLGNIFR